MKKTIKNDTCETYEYILATTKNNKVAILLDIDQSMPVCSGSIVDCTTYAARKGAQNGI